MMEELVRTLSKTTEFFSARSCQPINPVLTCDYLVTSPPNAEFGKKMLESWRLRRDALRKPMKKDKEKLEENGRADNKKCVNNSVNTDNIRQKEEVTEEDQKLIDERVKLMQKQLEDFERRERLEKIEKMMLSHKYLTEEEANFVIGDNKELDLDELMKLLYSLTELSNVRKAIACGYGGSASAGPRKRTIRKMGGKDDDPELVKLLQDRQANYINRKLLLKDALKDTINFTGWSPARIRAWKVKDKNPNAYYYRFNEPGEDQRGGKWTKAEHDLFMKRLEEMGANGQWGLFSIPIPGRVGYQCSNYYRALLKSGKIEDDNYSIDSSGKMHYNFKNGPAKKKKGGSGSEDEGGAKKRVSRKRRRACGDDYDSDPSDCEYNPNKHVRRRDLKKAQDEEEADAEEYINPLPGRMDPITMDEIEVPALAPSGYVMDYSSWLQCLENDAVCPFTKTPIIKDELVILTLKNIDEFRSQIKD
eukprot:GCRY01004216.1.p1 GENE.GCRY01004216.1~~GCRY01004216.1.p1  ORF type:complete len:476 (-),score=70.01 GCRY01004216.1:14-1441(-)